MARVMTSDELTAVRSDNQFSKLYAAILNPAVVFSCQINQVFTTTDQIVQFEYDNVTFGAFGDVVIGMTAYIGSTAGAYDLGMVRIRLAADSNTLFIGETSEIPFADNIFVTVVNEFGLWAKHPRVLSDGTVYMDWDVTYSNQHTNMKPVPVFGNHAVLWLTGADVDFTPDASDSWCLTAGAKTYLWTAPGASATSGLATATPTITYDTAGTYLVTCQVTVGGVSAIGYRYVFVYDADNMPFEVNLGSCSGEYDRGGWEFEIDILGAEADISLIRDRALVIIFARDFYDSEEISIGPIPGRENIIATGWIDGETIDWNPIEGSVNFAAKGPNHWLSQITAFPLGVENTVGTADDWTNFNELTIDKAVFDWITWRSTIAAVTDVYRTGDSRQASALEAPIGSLWGQMIAIADPILAFPVCDRYARLFVEINSQFVPVASRTGPVIMELTLDDWGDRVDIDRIVVPKTSRIDLSGINFTSGSQPSTFFSLAEGHPFKRFGAPLLIDRLLLTDQAQSNELAGLILGNHNHEFEFNVPVAENNRFVDICPAQYVEVDIAADETARGIAYAGNLVIREVEFNQDMETRKISVQWNGENETFEVLNVNGDILIDGAPEDYDLSVPPRFSGLALPDPLFLYPSPSEDNPDEPKTVVGYSTNFGVMYTLDFNAVNPTWYFMNNGLDTNDKTQIYQMVVTPNGTLYIMTNGSAATGFGKIMRATSLGGAWTTVFTATNRVYNGALRTVRVTGLGVNNFKPDEIGIVDTVDYIAFGATDVGRFYVGSTSFGAGASFFNRQINVPSACAFQNNKWGVFSTRPTGIGGSGTTPYLFRFSSAGAYETEANFATGPGQGLGAYRADVDQAGHLYLWVNAGSYDGYDIADITAMTFTFYDEATYGMNPEGQQGMTISPTGVYGMGSNDGTSTPKKTTDSLTTWVTVGGVIPIGSDVWTHCGDNMRYIFGGGIVIRLTMDQGASYSDKNGNLLTIAPLIDVTGLRFIN